MSRAPMLVTVGDVETAVISYKGARVCTTKQLARFYGCSEKNIQDNLENHRARFDAGRHFVTVEGDDLKMFKARYPDDIGVPLKFSPKLYLWTERGAARHAKILTTQKAWDMFEMMEDCYFASSGSVAIADSRPQRVASLTRSQVAASVYLIRAAAEDLGFAPSAVLGAYQRLESQIGATGLLPGYAIDAPADGAGSASSEETKSLTALLDQFGVNMSAIAFSRLLVQHGFLAERERPSSKGGVKKFKVCTDLEYGKNLTSPSNPRETQPHWYVSKFQELLSLVLPEPPSIIDLGKQGGL